MAKYKVMYTDTCFPDMSIEQEELAGIDAELVLAPATDEDSLIAAGQDCDGVIFDFAHLTERVLSNLPKCKVVSRVGIGLNNVDIPAASRNKIMVANVPDYCFDEVAEHAMALILSTLRNIPGYNEKVRKEKKWDFADAPKLYRINGMTMGLIGCGRIPRKAAVMAKGFGMKLVGYDPYLPKEVAEEFGIEMMPMERLAEVSDVILSHVPLMPSTEKMVGKNLFDHVKKQPIFVNTSRGGTVDHDALCDALESGAVRAAALDVVDEEPANFASRIFKYDNVIFTPHAAFYSETALEEVRRRSAENVTHFLAGEGDINYVVKPQ